MSLDASKDFFWQDGSSDGQLQRMSLDNFVLQEDQLQPVWVHLQEEPLSPSATAQAGSKGVNNSESPGTPRQALLSPGMMNPDAILPQSRSYTCRICQQTFPNKSAVTIHSKIHTNHEGKPYICSFCKKGFSTNFYLKQHERIHNGQKPYKCPMCDTSFKQLSHVQQHVRTHTGVRPYKCSWPGCDKAFLQQSHLKSHVARHSPKRSDGVRPYKCHWPDCGKSFAQISNLKSHVARHTPKAQKQQKNSASKQEPLHEQVVTEMPGDQNLIGAVDSSVFSLASVAPDVIGQAAAAADIVPAVDADCESICPFLCPGCSKLYVREATFKKHLEECKMKLQQSISATAAALGIEPPPLPPPMGHSLFTVSSVSPLDIMDHGSNEPPSKKSRKSQGPRFSPATVDRTRHEGQVIVRMPFGVDLSGSQPQDSAASDAKEEALNISASNILLKMPQQILESDQSPNEDCDNMNSLFSTVLYNPEMDGTIFTNQQLSTSTPINLRTVSPQVTASSQTAMTSAAEELLRPTTQAKTGTTTINQAVLNWQWNQPSPRMNFP